jgi:hypothetical protein
MKEFKEWLKNNYYPLLSQSETIGFKQAFDTIRLKVQDIIDNEDNEKPTMKYINNDTCSTIE